ncbi:5'-deoxy-5'-methylthioadenosine phosphorylase [Candidatus Methanoperedens nitroreducens]|uniref:S-methyl-5'-thioadenosine phosphorylase n=1 Tax=Candidatus Methanoperedens nitratireducens TaxID=1392998 RepID=A0A062V5W8_9EURY|nr:S-methyl-5'-thioadenosine phosphorylase [Candidatus Methanoperedens nitroreducens]KCZ72727.1 5'-deoxy-5'-methylthioadenosine phosphorylase [Candidatus Methanoperedens nitroreducens]MDJ1423340.1 S-methyl-5'-thioadenosine phosphorylase [Candidatus Methanoperedens sp.]
MNADIAIIGGSGVYDTSMLDNVKEVKINTPYGRPSDVITIGSFGEVNVAFLPRHGKGHHISPSRLNSRANILALKKLGVKRIISASAVGSLKPELKPLDIVIPDQIFDRTRIRDSTFFEDGIVVHIGFADPFCPEMSSLLADITNELGHTVHKKGTYVCMEGPQFSTRAESRVYQSLGFDIIGMTALPEAKLAREAEICYSIIATVTDYDVWHEEDVSIETVIANAIKNEETVRGIIKEAIPRIPHDRTCICASALSGAIVTAPDMIPDETKGRLNDLIGQYISG